MTKRHTIQADGEDRSYRRTRRGLFLAGGN